MSKILLLLFIIIVAGASTVAVAAGADGGTVAIDTATRNDGDGGDGMAWQRLGVAFNLTSL